jgi:hypothetical protein
MLHLCLAVIPSRSRFDALQPRLCQLPSDHDGKHSEFPFLKHLLKSHPAVAKKIVRDSIMTTGAAWKSEEAGPNRILRWVMLLPDETLLEYGINMNNLKPQVVAKLRDKAATYEECIQVAKRLTWTAYQMPGSPEPDAFTKDYLEDHFSTMIPGSTSCLICLEPLPFTLFSGAARGKAAIETGHMNPRHHDATNVGFVHRECNIAQGNKTLQEFYDWIAAILERANKI